MFSTVQSQSATIRFGQYSTETIERRATLQLKPEPNSELEVTPERISDLKRPFIDGVKHYDLQDKAYLLRDAAQKLRNELYNNARLCAQMLPDLQRESVDQRTQGAFQAMLTSTRYVAEAIQQADVTQLALAPLLEKLQQVLDALPYKVVDDIDTELSACKERIPEPIAEMLEARLYETPSVEGETNIKTAQNH